MGGLLVHEWIEERGGSERVFDAVAETFPEADLLCLWNDNPRGYLGKNLKETWLSNTPLRRSKPAALPFMPMTWRNQKDNSYEWVFVSSHLFAHHVSLRAKEPVDKYVYVHTPARYIWTPEMDERGAGILPRLASGPLRVLDRHRAKEAKSIAANSEFVRKRIESTWGLDSVVIYPPVDVSELGQVPDWYPRLTEQEQRAVENLPQTFVLGASRFVSYKRLDLVIEAGEASQLPVVLAGAGPLAQELRKQGSEASVPVMFFENPSDALIRYLYQKALVYVFPPVEDFGIMPVEAMAAGTPVVANAVGGAAESVLDGHTGALLEAFGRRELKHAVEVAASANSEDCFLRAKKFSKERFKSEVNEWITGTKVADDRAV